MENPESGLMKNREVVAGLPMRVVDYCKYGKPYRKRTTIWMNTAWVPQRTLCKRDCPASAGLRHTASAQRGGVGADPSDLRNIPGALGDEIAGYAWRSEGVGDF